MDRELYDLHITAGRKSGEERTCGKKVRYPSEELAFKSAEAMNKKPSTRHALEAYPCAFCGLWHLGGVMPLEVLRSFAATE